MIDLGPAMKKAVREMTGADPSGDRHQGRRHR
jgi:hypothetical protein